MAISEAAHTDWLIDPTAEELEETRRELGEIDRELISLPVRGSLVDRVKATVALVTERTRERDAWARAYRQLLRDIASERDPPDWAELMLDELMEKGQHEFLRELATDGSLRR